MPVHVAAQPYPGSQDEWREQECKRRIEGLSEKFGAAYLDLRTRSALTSNDANFWDSLHWRIPIGHQIVDKVAASRNARGGPSAR